MTIICAGKSIITNNTSSSENQSKISEFLQDMQELGIGDVSPSLLTPSSPRGNGTKTSPSLQSSQERGEAGPSRMVGAEEVVGGNGCGLSAVERRLVSEWVPLGLNFGIPLFDEEANKLVCKKVRKLCSVYSNHSLSIVTGRKDLIIVSISIMQIIRHKLLSPENLSKQTQTNRFLALNVLNFISQHQVSPYLTSGFSFPCT